MKKIITTILITVLLFSCKPDLAQEIYDSGDKSRYKEALEYILQDEKRAETSEGRKLIELLKVGYLGYKKGLIKEQYKDTRIAYLKDEDLVVCELFGEDEKTIGLFRDCTNFVWSPDGRYLAYENLLYKDIFIVEVTTGKTTRLTDEDEICQNPSWTADGKRVIYSLYNKIVEVNIETLEKRVIKKLFEDYAYYDYVYYPQELDDNRLVFLFQGILYEFDIKSDKVKELELIDDPDKFYYSSSAMKSLFLSHSKKQLLFGNKTVDLDKKVMGKVNNVIYKASWSPDDRYIVYSTNKGKKGRSIYLKDMTETLPFKDLDILIFEEWATVPAWSPILSEEILATFD